MTNLSPTIIKLNIYNFTKVYYDDNKSITTLIPSFYKGLTIREYVKERNCDIFVVPLGTEFIRSVAFEKVLYFVPNKDVQISGVDLYNIFKLLLDIYQMNFRPVPINSLFNICAGSTDWLENLILSYRLSTVEIPKVLQNQRQDQEKSQGLDQKKSQGLDQEKSQGQWLGKNQCQESTKNKWILLKPEEIITFPPNVKSVKLAQGSNVTFIGGTSHNLYYDQTSIDDLIDIQGRTKPYAKIGIKNYEGLRAVGTDNEQNSKTFIKFSEKEPINIYLTMSSDDTLIPGKKYTIYSVLAENGKKVGDKLYKHEVVADNEGSISVNHGESWIIEYPVK